MKKETIDDTKELKFRARMKALDEKAQQRRERKKEKLKKRARFLSEHKYLKYTWIATQVVVVSTALISLAYIGKVSHDIYQSYNDSVKWTKITGPALAEQSPDVLYSDEAEKQLKTEVTALITDVWDAENHLWKKEITSEQMDDITQLYNKITGSKMYLEPLYNEVHDMYQARELLMDIYTDGSFATIQHDMSLINLSDKTDKVFALIKPYLIKSSAYKQAANYLELVYSIANDSQNYATVLELANTFYSLNIKENKVLEFATTKQMKDLESLQSAISRLNLHYELVDKFITPIANSSVEGINQNDTYIAMAEQFQNDGKAEEQFKNYVGAYKNMMSHLQSQIIDYPNFVDKPLSEVRSWASANNITLEIKEKYNTLKDKDVVLEQSPTNQQYKKIVKASKITIIVNKIPTITSSSSSSNLASSSSSTTTNSSSSTSTSSSDIINNVPTDNSSATIYGERE